MFIRPENFAHEEVSDLPVFELHVQGAIRADRMKEPLPDPLVVMEANFFFGARYDYISVLL
jgi:hypothetical protein